jgi:hypothetical protein
MGRWLPLTNVAFAPPIAVVGEPMTSPRFRRKCNLTVRAGYRVLWHLALSGPDIRYNTRELERGNPVTVGAWYPKRYDPSKKEPAELILDRKRWPTCRSIV